MDMLIMAPESARVAALWIAFLSVLAGSIGVPIPSLAAVIFVGSLLYKQHASPLAIGLAFAVALAGAMLGDLALFAAGKRFGAGMLGMVCRLSLSKDSCIRRTESLFERRGVGILLVARFFPGLSVVCAPLAALSGIRVFRFLLFAETGAALWIATGLALGYGLADELHDVLLAFRHVGMDFGVVVAAIIAGYIVVSWLQRHRLLRQLRMARITVAELAEMLAGEIEPIILDARSAMQRGADPFAIPKAIVLDAAGEKIAVATAPAHRPIVVYCSCPNEISAAAIVKRLKAQGYHHVRPLLGGLTAWREAGHPVHALPAAAPAAPAPALGQHPESQLAG